jgi:hypothetical protein
VGITLSDDWLEPLAADSDVDVAAADRGMQFKMGIFANPIFGDGDFPEVIKERVAQQSSEVKSQTSRLPAFTDAEIKYIKGMCTSFAHTKTHRVRIHTCVNIYSTL